MERFAEIILAASEAEIRGDITLSKRLLLHEATPLTVSYAPFDHIERGAQVVIVGITPGLQQATNALLELRRRILNGAKFFEALSAAKSYASFSGPMRNNLVEMLNHIGLNKIIGLNSTSQLWESNKDLAHFTSALRYPVFVNGKNYSGQPRISTTPILLDMMRTYLAAEAEALPNAIWIPLGPVATEAANWLVTQEKIQSSHVLSGLPHPSGANAERIAYFLGRKHKSQLSRKTNSLLLDAARTDLIEKVTRLVVN